MKKIVSLKLINNYYGTFLLFKIFELNLQSFALKECLFLKNGMEMGGVLFNKQIK